MITEGGISASRSIAAASMCVVGERPDGGDGRLDRGPFGLGQLGVGEQRLAAELAPEQGLGEPGRLDARAQQLLRLADLPGPQGLVALGQGRGSRAPRSSLPWP